MQIKFFWRKPEFPLIINFNDRVIGIKSVNKLHKINFDNLPDESSFDVIDFSGEGWTLFIHSDVALFSPLSMSKEQTKKEIINLYNNRNNKNETDLEYNLKSVNNKKRNQIIKEIVDLLDKQGHNL